MMPIGLRRYLRSKGIHQKARLIQQACIDWIREPINGLDVFPIEFGADRGVVVVCIPASSLRPHMIVKENRTDFYRRYGTAEQTRSLDEIRSMILTNPANQRLIEDQLLASRKLVHPGRGKKTSGVPYARIFTEKSVEQFLHKYMSCTAFPQTLIIVSPFISDLAGELIDLEDIVDKINRDKTLTYVITSPTKEVYQQVSLAAITERPIHRNTAQTKRSTQNYIFAGAGRTKRRVLPCSVLEISPGVGYAIISSWG